MAHWREQVEASTAHSSIINIQDGLSRATLDVIGLAAFGFDFNCIENPKQDVVEAYRGFL